MTRIVNGRAICGSDCPMFERMKGNGKGFCQQENRPCLVGQLCFQPVLSGGNRYPFGRYSVTSKYRVQPGTGTSQRRGLS